MIRLIDPKDHRTVPWKNGGGTATDYAVEHMADGDVAWRIGTAEIVRDGPFSDYAGVTRVFTIIRGPGLFLDFPREGTRRVAPDRPTRFAGAPAPFSRLDGAPATAFNLLMRDDAFAGDVEIRRGQGRAEPLPAAGTLAVVALDGIWQIAGPAGEARLTTGCTALVDAASGMFLEGRLDDRAAIVRLDPI
ncbi:HutD/Ves family protein [Phreatobacter sp. AB_2022a]|uniref:HutD/Ves family protein n=1 Tax=Phreatobacter sp. AB_2022a TaxID=3003134 RepID=UPI0022871AAA|nr:HutD family protein [Phreatobacter sp. AB_2022a]MCZ0736388.1 HutD family protein [Phreatobacter sp. AB_2022a]